MRRPISAIRGLAASLALALLAGCATPGAAPDGERTADQWTAQQERLEELNTWTLVGKAGLRTPQETTSANLDWSQHPHYYRMLISGPFGSGRNLLEGREGRFSLTNAEGRFEAATPEALMQQQLGWSLPVSSLADWIRGLPADHSRYQLQQDERGFPQQLEQDGWQIVYRDWTQVESLWLPRRLVMEYDDLRVTLVVTEWRPVIDE
ncbi:lipoprotein localization protein LolB [Halomonas sp. MCCC 1A17488]|uniref:Outer-membrane lipoprotein LolB n=1 Tax=Billgrantia sulfidoxydans TaxID=2733484 RepID=A0ABX7W9D6_9GAMM|nr:MULTISPECIES: lipoprotein insertase outer membrane protein LolB [Halomonas]MCE8014570.1 lipoprotein localization protein LolB [Halomonas sp. MCCC 1A17488]MCG3237903.1 lipoprotein localization protein LolB [Halomonas sp. MCCC 1A17488]QPP48309.1 lipoprotein localization protein LolB [Halomonas sp. SS10-MC5]QTP55618.1 lipoprotein localization protein LolB [Halomonas sulfidoxydans]